jgi:hypothetical protein
MRYFVTLAAFFLIAGSALAGVKEFPLTAHVMDTSSHNSGSGTTSSYNPQTKQWTYGGYSGAVVHETDLLIGKIIYTIDRSCRVDVGNDYPAYIDAGKRKKRVYLQLSNGKTCRALVSGEKETK